MKRLLLTLLAALALPTTVSAEGFTEIKPKNIYSYKESTLVKYENKGKRFIEFIGTTLYTPCFAMDNPCHKGHFAIYEKNNWDKSTGTLSFEYELDCTSETFNKKGDNLTWTYLFVDQTALGVAQKYCPIEEWSKLPIK